MTPKKDVKSSESDRKVVAIWDDCKTEILLKICVEEIDVSNRPTSHFCKEGWKNITEKFEERAGYVYDRTQLKNRWVALRREFSSFAKLCTQQTEVGWDHDKQTIRADDEWWTAKSKEDPEILKWKNGGPKFLELFVKCFKGTVATRFVLYKPYQDPPPSEGLYAYFEDIEGHENNPNTENEGAGDSFEVGSEVPTNTTPSSSNTNLKKRKNLGKGEKMGTTEKLQRSLYLLVDQSSYTNVTGSNPENNVSYAKYLKMLDEIPTLVKGSHLYLKAVRVLAIKENRTTFSHFMNSMPEITFDWLSTFTDQDYLRSRR